MVATMHIEENNSVFGVESADVDANPTCLLLIIGEIDERDVLQRRLLLERNAETPVDIPETILFVPDQLWYSINITFY
jgi:hypothetical protein